MRAQTNNMRLSVSVSKLTADAAASTSQERLPVWVGAALIVACWLVNLLVVSPAGNFPLNDDWIYSESVQHLLQTGQFHLLGCSPACFLHVAIGAAAAA